MSVWLRRLSPSSGFPSSNPVSLFSTVFLESVQSVWEEWSLYSELEVHHPDLKCLFPSYLGGSNTWPGSMRSFCFLSWLDIWRYVKKPRLCLNVYWLASVTFSGETNLSSDFPSEVGNVSPLPSKSHHQCYYTHIHSAVVELHCSVSWAEQILLLLIFIHNCLFHHPF